MTQEPLDNEWRVDCSDDELYNPEQLSDPCIWQPHYRDVPSLLKEGQIHLEWQCTGRVDPESLEKKHEKVAEEVSTPVLKDKAKSKSAILQEFDLDDKVKPIDSYRTPNTKTPRTHKQADFEHIMNEVLQQKNTP